MSERTSSIFSLYGRAARVDSCARRRREAAMNWNARVICWMFFTAPIRRRISRWLATSHSPDRRSGEARPRRCRGPERTHSDVRERGTEGSNAGIVRSIVDLREEGFAEGLDGLIEGRGDFVGEVAGA